MKLDIIPQDSIVRHYLKLAQFMEAPYSYVTAICLSGISCLLRRNVYFSIDEGGLVTPNLSVLLIGKSGVGKDLSINMGVNRILRPFMPGHVIKGVTSEALAQNMFNIHRRTGENPTCGYVLAKEMRALFGGKDYQAGIIEWLTDILSDGEEYEGATKHNPFSIPRPTLVLQGGSTPDWFHKLPAGSLEGGFVPRCLIVMEENARQQVARPRHQMDFEDRKAKQEAAERFHDGVYQITQMFSRPYEMVMDDEAGPIYDNWYETRYTKFGPLIQDYDHRSRAHVLRLAMIMAVTRGKKIIELPDITFAMDFMTDICVRLEGAILPPNEEGKCVTAIKKLLPCTYSKAVVALRPKFPSKVVSTTWEALRGTGEIKLVGDKWVNA